MRTLWKRVLAVFRGTQLDRDLSEEIAAHLAMQEEEFRRRGMSVAEARAAARREFGSVAHTAEAYRERRGIPWIEITIKDVRYALRALARNPGFTAAAVLSLALGIGANTAIFSVLDTLLLRTAAVPKPHQLVRILDGTFDALTYPQFRAARRATLLAGVAAMQRPFGDVQIAERGEGRMAGLQPVSANYFDFLGLQPWRGRFFHEPDGTSPEGAIAVISDRYWRSHFAASESAIGATFSYADRVFTVVGIAPPGFAGMFVDFPADIWIPVEQTMNSSMRTFWARARAVSVLGRLRDGVSLPRAGAEISGLLRRRARVEPGGTGFSTLRGRFGTPLVVVQCIVGLVLLIACGNLANLLLARSAARQRELAVRQAIGAGRSRLVRQLLTENLLVSAFGAAAGLVVARWLSGALLSFLPPTSVPATGNLAFRLDLRILGFTAALALLTCLLFGLAPALYATRATLAEGLRTASARGVAGGRWMSRGLVMAEAAICTILLTGAGLFVQTLQNLRSTDSGLRPEGVVVATLQPPRGYPPEKIVPVLEAIRAQAGAIPGVRSAGFSSIGLLSGFGIQYHVDAPGYQQKTEDNLPFELTVSPGFFAAMGTPLLAGRAFTAGDDAGAPGVALINETFARTVFGGSLPIGKRFHTDESKMTADGLEVVGVVKDARLGNLREQPLPLYYRPWAQAPVFNATLAVGAGGDLRPVVAAIQQTIRRTEPHMTVKDVVPFTVIEDRTLVIERMVAQFASAFSVLAMIVACVGLYGVLACGVTRRSREIGVRMALGARSGGVQWMVLRESIAMTGGGFVIGAVCSMLAMRPLAAMLYGLSAGDAGNLLTALAVMMAVSLAGAWVPARRAAHVDPMAALRCD